MKKYLKIFIIGFLPLITFMTCIVIGAINERLISIREGPHPTMKGGISLYGWIWRGIFAAIIIYVFSRFVLFSKLNIKRKIILFMLVLICNSPLFYFMELMYCFHAHLIIVPLINIIPFIPSKIMLNKTNE